MQVRKFEAKSIREAIEMVKFELGPDAVILSAKENKKSFGLAGESSVEVTAAVSENKLRRKQLAERKLDQRHRDKYQKSSARVQREFIQKSFEEDFEPRTPEKTVETPEPPRPRAMTARRYAEIDDTQDEVNLSTAGSGPSPRIVAQQAPMPKTEAELNRIHVLQSEVNYLKGMLEKFQNVPQNIISLHPGAEEGLPFELSFAFKRLQESGIANEHIVRILKLANQSLPAEQKKKKALVDGWVIKHFLEQIQTQDKPFTKKYQVFVGPTGQGKTSIVIKLACQLLLKARKKVALITGDTVKVGAVDQLKIFGQILNVPSGAVNNKKDWQELSQNFQNVDYVFVDTPGVNLRNPGDLDLIRDMLPLHKDQIQLHFVQSVLARDAEAFEVAERFKAIGFEDVIFTRLDEAVQYGLIYNFQKHFNVPLHSFGIGNNIPEDFEMATKERVIDLIFNLSNFRKERGLA